MANCVESLAEILTILRSQKKVRGSVTERERGKGRRERDRDRETEREAEKSWGSVCKRR